LNGLAIADGSVYIIDTFGALYETTTEKKFEPFKQNLKQQDNLSFIINEEVKFTFDLLDVTEVYNALVSS